MSNARPLQNVVRQRRRQCGWSQEELARRAGISRTGLSAVETGRLVPSAATALALAGVLGSRVEDLFSLTPGEPDEPVWAWPPGRDNCRYWKAEVAGRTLLYPVETFGLQTIAHDGVCAGGTCKERSPIEPERTLVMACCDPAAGLLAAELRQFGIRLIVLHRSSREALKLLHQRLVHVAGTHLGSANEPERNAEAVQATVGVPCRLLRSAEWDEGVAFTPTRRFRTVRSAARSRIRWVGREAGSGARQCLEELLARRRLPRRLARDHRGVAEAIRNGWADAGVCLRLVSEEAGLAFLRIRTEAYDLCFRQETETDPRLETLIEAVRSPSYRGLLGDLPGYDVSSTGEVQTVGHPAASRERSC